MYSANPLCLIFSKVNRSFDKNKYLTLFPTDQRKEKIKKYE